MEFPDRQFETLTPNYALIASTLSNVGALLYMTVIQLLLLGIHYSNQKVKAPTSLELNLVVTVLWCFHRALDNGFGLLFAFLVYIMSPGDTFTEYQNFRLESGSLVYSRRRARALSVSDWDGLLSLFYEVLVTWLIFQSLVFLLDTILPVFRDIRLGNHQYLAVRFYSRILELFDFGRRIYEYNGSKYSAVEFRSYDKGIWEDENISSQLIRLKRVQMTFPDKGQRTLNWDLTIDKKALKEMKETLGPPGGFGELGFNVASDRVSFGAMGIGTSFNLTFILEPNPET